MLGAQVITALQSIVSRNVRPLESSVLTIGKVSAGTRYNVLADTFEMEGTCRNLNPAVRDFMAQRMEEIIRGITQGMGGDYTFRYVRGYSPVINDPDMAQLVHDAAAEAATPDLTIVPGELGMGGEDFSFYAEQVPACFYRVGCHKEGTPKYPQHNSHFLPDERALYLGSRIMLASALRYLSQP